jgi:hypothetical protein
MREAEAARVASGTSYAAIGRALRISGTAVAKLLRTQSPNLSIVRAAQILAAVGLELSARAYPVGPPVRDAGQLALLARLRQRIHPNLRWREEVVVVELPRPGAVDLRAWDAAIDGANVRVRVDAETRLGDAQAVTRRVAAKRRDGDADCVILLLSDTRHHRHLLAEIGDGLRGSFPISQRAALAALRAGRSPGGDALIVL